MERLLTSTRPGAPWAAEWDATSVAAHDYRPRAFGCTAIDGGPSRRANPVGHRPFSIHASPRELAQMLFSYFR